MRVHRSAVSLAIGLGVTVLSVARAQAPPTAAKVDTEPLALTPPDRFQIPCYLEPIRRVTLAATADGVVRSQDAKAGAAVRADQEVAQLDRREAAARLKIAQAAVKEEQAMLDVSTGGAKVASGPLIDRLHARIEAAQAGAELAQIAFDRCSLRAPFAGKVLASHVTDGQFVTKGTVLAEVADVTSLRVLVPVRRGTAVGSTAVVTVEGQSISGKVQAVVPLPESMSVLRELASPFSAAWVVVPNTDSALEPGQRASTPALPAASVATIPAHALQKAADASSGGGTATVQIIRNDLVNNIKVRVLGNTGVGQVQVSGPFRPTDALIVSSNVPLLAGTLIRFNSGGGPTSADLDDPSELPPPRAGGRPPRPGPGGRPGGRPRASTRPNAPLPEPAPREGGPATPF